MHDNFELGKRLRMLRVEKGISQKDISLLLGIGSREVSKIECGLRKPRISQSLVLANYFDVSLDWLLSRAAERKGYYVSKL